MSDSDGNTPSNKNSDISREKFNRIINNIVDIITEVDLKGYFTYASPQIYDILGYTSEEIVGLNGLKLIHPNDLPKTLDKMKETINSGETMTMDYRTQHKDGHYVYISAKGGIIREKGNVKFLAVLRDVSKQKAMEEKLIKSEEKYREAFERTEIYKDLFAHDISNILQNIKSSIGLMSIWQDKPDQEMINEVIQIMNNQIIRGAKLISNIRRLSQITEKSELMENIKPIDKLNEAIRFLKKSYHKKQIVIKVESQINDMYIKANALLLDVYENIMINAVKYNENPIIEILIRISKLKENDIDYIKFEFVDNGIGISDSIKEGIFNGTTKREDRSKGMGLGLILVRRIIQSFNGKIWVEDNVKGDPSKGSNFIIQLLEVK